MAKERPIWAEDRVEKLLESGENVLFETKGRVELKPTTGIGALLFWISYILTNILGFIYGLIIRKTAWIVFTNKKVIIVTNDGANWPFWVIPIGRSNMDYMIAKDSIASINCADSFTLWGIRSRGFSIESKGSLSIIFNGVSRNEMDSAKKIISAY